MFATKLTIAMLLLGLMAACGSATSVEMTRRIDLLEVMNVPPGSTTINGFRLGTELDAPLLTEAQWTAETRTLPGAGSETPPCNDGTAHRLNKVGGRAEDDLFIAVEAIGDTGGDDVSDDRDCGCDTHISRLLFNNLSIEAEPSIPDYANLTLGKDHLCPNRLDDLVVGDSEFGGAVTVDFSGTLRVEDGGLWLDVTYFVREVP